MLDSYFYELQQHIVHLSSLLQKPLRVRVSAWLRKMREPGANSLPEWKRNRNEYAKLLLMQLRSCALRSPFDSMPPDGALPKLPAHLRPPRKATRESAFNLGQPYYTQHVPLDNQQPARTKGTRNAQAMQHPQPGRGADTHPVNRMQQLDTTDDEAEGDAAGSSLMQQQAEGGQENSREAQLSRELQQKRDELEDARAALQQQREAHEQQMHAMREQHRQELEQLIQRFGGVFTTGGNVTTSRPPAAVSREHQSQSECTDEHARHQHGCKTHDKEDGSYHSQIASRAMKQRENYSCPSVSVNGTSLEQYEKEVCTTCLIIVCIYVALISMGPGKGAAKTKHQSLIIKLCLILLSSFFSFLCRLIN